MAKFCDRLRSLRTSKGLSQSDFSKQIGISKSSVNMYERGEREPNFKTLEHIADYFNVDMDYLLGKSDIVSKLQFTAAIPVANNVIPMPEMRKIPLVGTIACGAPILAEENIEEYISVP